MQVWTNSKRNGPIDQYDYDIVKGDQSLSLFASNSPEWVYPNQEMATINDNGEGYDILMDDTEFSLDYLEAQQLFILLAAMNQDKIRITESKTIFEI